MNLFYIRHHVQSIVRSTSFDGEVFAFILLGILFGGSVSMTFNQLDTFARGLSAFFSFSEVSYSFFLMVYVFLDLTIRLVFRRPLPKMKYYVLWSDASRQIASQYLFASMFGIIPFVMGITVLTVSFKALEWAGTSAMVAVLTWWLANHFIGLIAQFSNSKIKLVIAMLMFLILIIQWLIPQAQIAPFFMHPILSAIALLLSAFIAYRLVRSSIERREMYVEGSTFSLLESLPVLSFKNPVFQLEWALLVRNKRTRSNLLMGLVSVLILPFLIDTETPRMILTFIFFITTGFFIIQHGVYSLGWEGSYFDFLITNISPKVFIKTRYFFYMGTCLIGLVLATLPTIINDLGWKNLFAIFLYNAGVTVPLVLYRSTLNSTRIVLAENSFMNYNGMMTGPIFVSSFLVMLIPLFLVGIGEAMMGENAMYLLGLIGLSGLVLFKPLTDLIAKKYHSRKYHLSQSFKA